MSDIQASHSRDVWTSVQDDTVSLRGNGATCLLSQHTMNRFVIQPAYAGGVAWCTEHSGCRVEYLNFHCVVCGWTVREVGGGSIKCWVPFIKEKVPNEVIKIDLTDVFPKCLEQG